MTNAENALLRFERAACALAMAPRGEGHEAKLAEIERVYLARRRQMLEMLQSRKD